MKRILGIGFLVLVLFLGCDALGTIINPVVGTWEVTVLGVVTSDTYHADKTCSETISVLGIGETVTGTWDSDGTLLTRTWSDDSSDSFYYTFSADNNQMTLSSTPEGLSVTYDRM